MIQEANPLGPKEWPAQDEAGRCQGALPPPSL